MGTKADFYLGRDSEAEWLGSLGWDAYPTGLPSVLRTATDETTYREAVRALLDSRADGFKPQDGWPWPWVSSHGTNYSYAFEEGKVWACTFGSSWWEINAPEPEHTALKWKAARLPDMGCLPKNPNGLVIPKPERRKKKTVPVAKPDKAPVS